MEKQQEMTRGHPSEVMPSTPIPISCVLPWESLTVVLLKEVLAHVLNTDTQPVRLPSLEPCPQVMLPPVDRGRE